MAVIQRELTVLGKAIGGTAMRTPEELPSRRQALALFAEGSAWFSFDESAGVRLSLACRLI